MYQVIDLVYMTGILPKRRSTLQTGLNNFDEYTMIRSFRLESYIGFTEKDVKGLCSKYNKDFNEIKKWYGGYKLGDTELYSSKSYVESLMPGKCKNYLPKSSAIESITYYLEYQNGNIKKEIALLLNGEKIEVDTGMFENDLNKIYFADSALTALIHLGYLSYDKNSKTCYIPNYEMREKFVITLAKL